MLHVTGFVWWLDAFVLSIVVNAIICRFAINPAHGATFGASAFRTRKMTAHTVLFQAVTGVNTCFLVATVLVEIVAIQLVRQSLFLCPLRSIRFKVIHEFGIGYEIRQVFFDILRTLFEHSICVEHQWDVFRLILKHFAQLFGEGLAALSFTLWNANDFYCVLFFFRLHFSKMWAAWLSPFDWRIS